MKANIKAAGCFMGLMIFAVLLSSCAGVKTYSSDLKKNLLIRTDTQSGSAFSKVRASMEIYRALPECKLEFLGNVDLSKPLVEVGIPSGKKSYLAFYFDSSSFLGSSKSSISYETFLKPRAGRFYNIKVTYLDDMYDVVVRESKSRKAGGREIEQRDLRSCKPR